MKARIRIRPPEWLQPELVYPIQPAPRTAVLVAGFRSRGKIRVFRDGWDEGARRYAPAAIAAAPAQIEALCATSIPSLSHAVIVIIRAGEPPFTEALREQVWAAFRVPVFEQIVSKSCKLLAYECEAHDGLHTESDELLVEIANIETARCACGLATPRLIHSKRETLRSIAVYAH